MDQLDENTTMALAGVVVAGVVIAAWAMMGNGAEPAPTKSKRSKKKKKSSKRADVPAGKPSAASAKPSQEAETDVTEDKVEGKTRRRRVRKRDPVKKALRKQRKAMEKAMGTPMPMDVPKDPETKKSTAVKKKTKKAAPVDDGWATITKKKKKKSNKPRARAFNPDAEVTETVQVDSKKLGAIIGAQAKTLHAIQDKTGTKIQIPPRTDGAQTRQASKVSVKVTGPAKGVKDALSAIKSIVTKGFSPLLNADMTEGAVQVPASQLHEIIGKGGKFIKALQEGTGAKINIPRVERGTAAASRPQKVGLVGTRDEVKTVKAAIKHLLKYHFCEYTHPGCIFVEMELFGSQLGKLIGPRGQTVKSIQGDTKTTIHTPSRDSINQKVVIVGKQANVAAAQARITKLLADWEAAQDTAGGPQEDYDYDYEEDY